MGEYEALVPDPNAGPCGADLGDNAVADVAETGSGVRDHQARGGADDDGGMGHEKYPIKAPQMAPRGRW